MGGLAAGGDVRVLGQPEGVEAALLDGAGQLDGVDGDVGGEHRDAVAHRACSSGGVRRRTEPTAPPPGAPPGLSPPRPRTPRPPPGAGAPPWGEGWAPPPPARPGGPRPPATCPC